MKSLSPTDLAPLPTEETRLGRQLAGGQVTVTLRSRQSGKHVTLSFRSRRRTKPGSARRWERCSFADADVVFVQEDHTGLRIGRIARVEGYSFPAIFVDPGTPEALAWALRETLWEAAGRPSQHAEIKTADRCGACNRRLTDPVSLERGIGPECFGKQTGSQYASKKAQ